MSSHPPDQARVIPLRSASAPAAPVPAPSVREPLWRHVLGDVLRRERLAQRRTLKDVADTARISMPYLSEIERGRKEASSEVLAAAARALGLGLGDLLTLARDELARFGRARLAETAAPPVAEPGAGSGPAGTSGAGGQAAPPAGASTRHTGPRATLRASVSLAA